MQLLDHYLRLCTYLPGIVFGQGQAITLSEIASILCCTERNGKLTIKKMEEMNWITWQPGRGRGHYSVLTLLSQPEDVLFGMARELVQKGEIRSATTMVHDYTTQLPDVVDRFHQWLHSHFGYRVETQENRTVDLLRTFYDRPFLTLDPAHVVIRSDCHMVTHLFDGLVHFNADTQQLEPQIAHYWESNEHGTEWTFYLRKGVLFHHGRELTARDVVFTLNRLRNPLLNSPYRWMFAQLSNVRAVSDRIVQITLAQPNHFFAHFMSNEHASIVPHGYCEEVGHQFARLPVGTGPFNVVRNDETMLVFEAFAPYFRERALLDRVEIWIVPTMHVTDQQTGTASGDMRYQPYQATTTLAQEQQTATTTTKGLQFLTFNLGKKGPQQHPAFREAIHRLLDREKMIMELGDARAEAAWGLDPDTQQAEEVSHDLTEVRRLLETSGYNGEVLHLHTYGDVDHVEDSLWIQKQCAEVGVRIEPAFLSVAEMEETNRIRQADLILDGGTISENIDFSYLDLFLTPPFFVHEHLGPELRPFALQQTTAALASSDPAVRREILLGIERRLIAERMLLCLYRVRLSVTAPPYLRGLRLNAHGWVDYRNLWFKTNKKHVPNIRKPEYT